MYVCVCNAVTDSEIRKAYDEGAKTLEALQDELAVSTCCGCCEPTVREILARCQAEDETHSKSAVTAAVRPNFAVATAG